MNNALANFLKESGMTTVQASCKSGVPYITVRQHIKGMRGISPQIALQYEKTLGISRSELRPDLWPASSLANCESEEN